MDGLCVPLTLRTNWRAAAEISSGVTGVSGRRRTLMLRHIVIRAIMLLWPRSTMEPFQEGPVRGFLHRPAESAAAGLVLTHGAGGNCKAPLLIAVAEAFCAQGYYVLRCD